MQCAHLGSNRPQQPNMVAFVEMGDSRKTVHRADFQSWRGSGKRRGWRGDFVSTDETVADLLGQGIARNGGIRNGAIIWEMAAPGHNQTNGDTARKVPTWV